MAQTKEETRSSARAFGVFGIYRYVLATMVMLSHFLPGRWEVIGEFAVFGFFILSGYVVCYILHYTYLPQKNGLEKFALNRALRIYPPFWISSLLILLILATLYPAPPPDAHTILGYPHNAGWQMFLPWLALNLMAMNSLLLFGYMINPSLMPAGWSLGIEIFFWALMPLMLTRPFVRGMLFVFAAFYTLAMIGVSFNPPRDILVLRYFSPMAATLPFSIGLWCFLRKQNDAPPVPHALGLCAAVLLCLLAVCCRMTDANPYFWGFYAATGLNTLTVMYLTRFDPRSLAPWLEKTDRFCGDLSYPIFLMHVPVSLLLPVVLPSFAGEHAVLFVLLGIFTSNLCAFLLYAGVESPLNRLRRAVKSA